jgi:hypothetical protein
MFFAFLLSFIFSFNAAYAGVMGVCDAADHLTQTGTEHRICIGHNSHDASDSVAEATTHGDSSDPLKASKASCDHCHIHGASFSMAMEANLTMPLLLGKHIQVALLTAAPVSTTPDRLERPPRAPLA